VTAVFAGHLIGLLVPRSWTAAVGINDAAYRLISATAGTLAGCIMLVGLVLLVARRAVLRQQTTTIMDVAMYAVLTVVVLLGIWATVGVNLLGAGHDYRQTVAVWFRGLLLLRPQPSLMAGAPLLLQIHTAAAFALVAIWPFTRLVHALAVPIGLVWQPSATSPAYRDTNPASRPVERSRRSSPSGGIETPASTQ
jgi:nitrate reductase gamma subunit